MEILFGVKTTKENKQKRVQGSVNVCACVCGGEASFPERRGARWHEEWMRTVCLYELCCWVDENHCCLRLHLTGWLAAYLHITLSLYAPVLTHPELKARRVVLGWFLKWLNTLYCFINLFQTLPCNWLCKPQFSVCFYWSNIMTCIYAVHGFWWTVEGTDWKKGTWWMEKTLICF